MKYFYDTEFLEDGKTIDLISIGIVAEDGREYYAVNSEMPIQRIRRNDWLLRNVMPHLPIIGRSSLEKYIKHPPNFYPKPTAESLDVDILDVRVKPRRVIANEVREFLLARSEPELWSWYSAYDHVVLAQLFGRMIDLPAGIPMWTNDVQQLKHMLGHPEIALQADGLHDALADARHCRRLHQDLQGRSA